MIITGNRKLWSEDTVVLTKADRIEWQIITWSSYIPCRFNSRFPSNIHLVTRKIYGFYMNTRYEEDPERKTETRTCTSKKLPSLPLLLILVFYKSQNQELSSRLGSWIGTSDKDLDWFTVAQDRFYQETRDMFLKRSKFSVRRTTSHF